MMQLNHIPRKFTAGQALSKSQENINHLMYMDDIQLFAINERELETQIQTVRIYSKKSAGDEAKRQLHKNVASNSD